MGKNDNDEIRKKLGDNIRCLRKQLRYSQMKFAEVVGLGVTQAAVSAWEIGIREPDLTIIFRIADKFGVPVSSLIPLNVSDTDETVHELSAAFEKNPSLYSVFNKMKFFDSKQISVIESVVDAISKEEKTE